jgi:hypothetical protein
MAEHVRERRAGEFALGPEMPALRERGEVLALRASVDEAVERERVGRIRD